MRPGTHTKLLWQECPGCGLGAALMSEDGTVLDCYCAWLRRRDGTGHGEHGEKS